MVCFSVVVVFCSVFLYFFFFVLFLYCFVLFCIVFVLFFIVLYCFVVVESGWLGIRNIAKNKIKIISSIFLFIIFIFKKANR